jgi:cyclopropane fatty-acyl-phospholipid synthase-like methyltransferase
MPGAGAASPCPQPSTVRLEPPESGTSADAVRSYYELLGDLFRAAWGESLHFAVYSGTQTREEAAAATERMIAEDGRFGPGMSVLDVGCGSGGPALTMAAQWEVHVTGVDLVPRHIERAREHAAARGLDGRTAFLEADATSLPFPDASFDHVYAIESAYHAPDKARFYAECARVLRPGGSFLGTDWLHGNGGAGEDGERLLEPVRRHHAIPGLVGLDELRAHLEDCGLEPRVVADLAERGDILRNWEPRPEIWPKLAGAARNAPPGALREWRAGAEAIEAAAREGALIFGYWHARKPAAPEQRIHAVPDA